MQFVEICPSYSISVFTKKINRKCHETDGALPQIVV